MMAFFIRMLRDKYRLWLGYIVMTIILIETYVALFPSIKQQASGFDQMLQSMPAGLLKAFGMDPANFSFGSFQGYMSSEYLSFLWPIIAIAFAISIANYVSVRETDSGTIEALLSLPVQRSRILLERYLAGLVLIVTFAFASLLSALPLAQLHNVTFQTDNFITAAIGASLFTACVYTLATLMSVLFTVKGKATMVSSGILIAMYVMNVIASLNDNLKNLRYGSIFNYFNGSDLLSKNVYPDYMFIALGGAIIILFSLAAVWFNRRDFSA